MDESVFRVSAPLDANAEILAGGGDAAQTDLAANPQENYLEQNTVDENAVYRSAQRAIFNSLPKTNQLAPPDTPSIYANPVRWHPVMHGVNAGMRVNNVHVNYLGAGNVFRKYSVPV